MGLDYGFFDALTGPMKAAGDIQANRDARAMQQMQQEQQIKNQQLQEQNRDEAYQQQLSAATDKALQDIHTDNGFARKKDIDDFTNWHTDLSGWKSIQEVLREHGSIDNARLNGNLDYLMAEYKAKLKDNPISNRINQNKSSLEKYHQVALDPKHQQFITQGQSDRYEQFVNNKTDNFVFHGQRSDYLDQASKTLSVSDQLDLDEVIGSNYQAIIKDMINDQNPDDPQAFMQSLSQEDIRTWVGKELRYDEGSGFFNDKGIYGVKEIDTEFATEMVRSLDAVGSTGIAKGSDYFRNRDQGVSFKELFDGTAAMDWDRLGGYDKNSEMKNYKGVKAPFAKGRQMVGSGRVFANNQMLENAITQSWAGDYGDEAKSSRYNSKSRQVNDVSMQGLYDSRGHKITDGDIASTWLTGSGSWQESETDDLRLTGYHIALEGKNKDGDAFLLTDVSNEEDMNKLREQYKNTVFDYVVVAEMIDDDMVSHDDAYYKKVDMGDPTIQAALNEKIDSTDLNRVKTQMATYEQSLAQKTYNNKRKASGNAILQKQMNLPSEPAVDEFIGAYDQSLSIGLGMASVPSTKIQQAIPLLMSDLYVDSQQEREYPVQVGDKMARNSSEYMALSTQVLKKGLINRSSAVLDMLKALHANMNARKKAGTSRSKKDSTISKKAYSNMKSGFKKKKK